MFRYQIEEADRVSKKLHLQKCQVGKKIEPKEEVEGAAEIFPEEEEEEAVGYKETGTPEINGKEVIKITVVDIKTIAVATKITVVDIKIIAVATKIIMARIIGEAIKTAVVAFRITGAIMIIEVMIEEVTEEIEAIEEEEAGGEIEEITGTTKTTEEATGKKISSNVK